MPEFRYLGLQDNIINASIREATDQSWLIYPTERSCKLALQEYQKNWQPINLRFLSMDEFKQEVIFSNNVCLQDEKRLICLYQSMKPEDRAYFHIEKYPDIIDWGQHFFSFFEELAEECVDADELIIRMDKLDFDFQPWQYDNYSHILHIRKQYQQFITQKGYTDRIFDLDINNLHLPEGIRYFVFVNQLYYSGLERKIIEAGEEKQIKVTILFQGKENWLDKTTLKSRELVLSDAFTGDKLPFDLMIYQSSSAWQMALTFLKNSMEKKSTHVKHLIIDSKFHDQPYRTAFSAEHFHFSEQEPIFNTTLFRFLQIVSKGLESIVVLKDKIPVPAFAGRDPKAGMTAYGKKLIKLDWLLQAVGIAGFTGYFRPDWNDAQMDSLVDDLCKLSEKDILYLDLELNIFNLEGIPPISAETIAFLKDLMQLMKKFRQVMNLSDVIALLDEKDGLNLRSLLSQDEKNYSDLYESFYTALANFASMDELCLVQDWQALYPNTELSCALMDLLLTFIKPRKYKYHKKDDYSIKPDITNLMDTRNLQTDKATFLNMVEGELPSGRKPVWLFNERQRRSIGLKTWDDVRNWERYYFYRLIASSQEVEIYTIHNQEKDIEPGSFIYELYHFAQTKQDSKADWQKADIPAGALIQNRFVTDTADPLATHTTIKATELDKFLNLPFDKEHDTGDDKQFKLSWSACEHFLTSPFVYYLKDLAKLKEKTTVLNETMSRKMFGNLLHSYLNAISKRLQEQHEGQLSMQWEWINEDFLESNLRSTLNEPINDYLIPLNYNREYLDKLLSPFLKDTAGYFFHTGLAKEEGLEDEFIRIIAETSRMTGKELEYKQLIKPAESETEIGIALRGKADLRLETREMKYIIDFKTGGFSELQLLFYMLTYYLIDQPDLEGHVKAAIYKLMDKQLEWLNNDSKYVPSLLIDKIKEALLTLVTVGYAVPTSAKVMDYYIDITRADLLHKINTDEEESE